MSRRRFISDSIKLLSLAPLAKAFAFFQTGSNARASTTTSKPLTGGGYGSTEDITTVSTSKQQSLPNGFLTFWADQSPAYGSMTISVQVNPPIFKLPLPAGTKTTAQIVGYRLALLSDIGAFIGSRQGTPTYSPIHIFEKIAIPFEDGVQPTGIQVWLTVQYSDSTVAHYVKSFPESVKGSVLNLQQLPTALTASMKHNGVFSSPEAGLGMDFCANVGHTNPVLPILEFSAPFRAFFPWIEFQVGNQTASLLCFFNPIVPSNLKQIFIANPAGQILVTQVYSPTQKSVVKGALENSLLDVNVADSNSPVQKTCELLTISGVKMNTLIELPWVMIFFNYDNFLLKMNVSLHGVF